MNPRFNICSVVLNMSVFSSVLLRTAESMEHGHVEPKGYGYSVRLINDWDDNHELHCSCYTLTVTGDPPNTHNREVDVAEIPYGESRAHEGPTIQVEPHETSKYNCKLAWHDIQNKKEKKEKRDGEVDNEDKIKEKTFELFSKEIALWYFEENDGHYEGIWNVQEYSILTHHSFGESIVYTW